jgi:hypothetical protein
MMMVVIGTVPFRLAFKAGSKYDGPGRISVRSDELSWCRAPPFAAS